MSDYDRQDPKVLLVAVVAVGILVFTVLAGGFVQAYFNQVARAEYHAKVETTPSPQLEKLREDSKAKLTQYGWVNKDAQVVQLPLDRAIELTVADLQVKKSAPMEEPADKKAPAKKTK
jgi:hypothetical protein